jgi:hypothetical protein
MKHTINLRNRFFPLISLIMLLIFFCSIQFPLSNAQSVSCEFGEMDAWISRDNETWLNTTLSNLSLKSGQIFFVKVHMQSYLNDTWLALYLFEPGTTTFSEETFTVLKGPCVLNDGFDLGKTTAFEEKIVIWKLKVKENPVWMNGTTPLSITGFFQQQKQDQWETRDISFSIALIHILDNETNSTDLSMIKQDNEETSTFPVNLLIALPISCCLLLMYGVYQKK